MDGVPVSRDLLDSIIELNFLEEALEISSRKALRVIDIGAGYGRLAHRATVAAPMIGYVCTDGIALSTVLCETYLQYRKTERTAVVPLDEVSVVVSDSHFDLAINIHSFSECPLARRDRMVGTIHGRRASPVSHARSKRRVEISRARRH
jgi:hypothetical protein